MVPHEDVDVEKKEEEEAVSSKLATPDFPEGGWMAWGVVLGSWLGSESRAKVKLLGLTYSVCNFWLRQRLRSLPGARGSNSPGRTC
jgi:hypothetical protein